MRTIEFSIIAAPEILTGSVECFRIAEYPDMRELAIKVCPNGLPGIVFQHRNQQSVIKNITTKSGRIVQVPTSFVYGQVTELSVMNFMGPFMTIQVILKPTGLKSLFGIDASTLTNGSLNLTEFTKGDLNAQLMLAATGQERLSLLTRFLIEKHNEMHDRDELIEKSISLVQECIDSVTVEYLLQRLSISERQFERRFRQTVGISPQFYIRLRRVNEAMKLIDTGKYERLSDVAQALNFYDQSHFIRDLKTFFGITPKSISQKVYEFRHDQVGSSYF